MAMASLPSRTERSPHSPSSPHHPISLGYAKHGSFPNPNPNANPASNAPRGGVEPQRLPSLNLVFNDGSVLPPPAVPLASIATADNHPVTTSTSRDRPFSASSSASFPTTTRVLSPHEAASYSHPPRPQSVPRRSNSSPHIHSLSATDVRRAHPYRPPPHRPATAYPTSGATRVFAQPTSPVFSVPPPRPSHVPPPRPLQSTGSLQRDLLPSPLPRVETRTAPSQATKSARSTSSSSLSPEAIVDGQSSRRRGRTATACRFCQSRKQRVSRADLPETSSYHKTRPYAHADLRKVLGRKSLRELRVSRRRRVVPLSHPARPHLVPAPSLTFDVVLGQTPLPAQHESAEHQVQNQASALTQRHRLQAQDRPRRQRRPQRYSRIPPNARGFGTTRT